VYGLENFVDMLSDAVVIWRFYCPAVLNDEVEELLKKREKRATIAISTVLTLLSVVIIATAIHDLQRGRERLEESGLIIVISSISLVVFGFLAIVKLHYSRVLKSSSLQKDGICTLIGATLSLSLLVDALIVRKFPSAWWFDPTVALGCGIAALTIGLQSIIVALFVH
jgi:divalent metal cation (Fe/Co/Zn/Cd) transporter